MGFPGPPQTLNFEPGTPRDALMSETSPVQGLQPPPGLVAELVTPLSASGGLDGEALSRLTARVLPGADAILVGSPRVGEALELSPEVRRELFTRSLSLVAGRKPLLLGITGDTAAATLDLAQHATAEVARQGYAAPVFLADLPLWYHSNRGLPQWCRELTAAAPLPLVLLNLPDLIRLRAPIFKRRNLRTHVLKKLTRLPALVGLIYQGEMGRLLHYHHAALARPGFAFYEAGEGNFLSRPGAWGVVSPGAQLFPRSWQRLTRVCLHPEEAPEDQEGRLDLWSMSQLLQEAARGYRRHPAALIKAALAARGVLAGAGAAPGTSPPPPPVREAFLAFMASCPPED